MAVGVEVSAIIPQSLSLYLELEEGQNADLVVIARTSLAFAEAVREIAYIIDPSLEITIDFASGTPGSLSLNTIIKNIKKTKVPNATLKTIAFVVLGWLGNDLRAYGVGKFMDELVFPIEQRQGLSDSEIRRIAQALQNTLDEKIAKSPVQKIYREVERDTAIKGIGATLTPGLRPKDIVPRLQFQERSGLSPVSEEEQPQKRIRTTIERITLISPVLLPRNRSWKFYLPQIGEFGAKIRDERFLASLLSGRRRIPMRAGIQIDVELDTGEVRVGNVWVVAGRSIRRVIKVRRGPSAPDLFSSR